MPIRKALPSDHKRMAEIAAKAFIDDDVFGRFMYPYRREFPQDYESMWERNLWVNTNDYLREYLVACEEDTGKVVAWISWMRNGDEGERKRRNWTQRMNDSSNASIPTDGFRSEVLVYISTRYALQYDLARQIQFSLQHPRLPRIYSFRNASLGPHQESLRRMADRMSLHATRKRGQRPRNRLGGMGNPRSFQGGSLSLRDRGVEKGKFLLEIRFSRGRESRCRTARRQGQGRSCHV